MVHAITGRLRDFGSVLARSALVQFFALGLVLLALVELFGAWESAPSRKLIKVDEAALLEFVQYRSRNFDEASARQILAQMPETERAALVQEYVREEALYREAIALGLDQSDYVIRRRLVQKLEFLAEAGAPRDRAPTDVAEYYAAHKQDYRQPARLTFTHIFFDRETRGAQTQAAAQEFARTQNLSALKAADALRLGDRFAFDTNYAERRADEIADLFSPAFLDALLAAPLQTWRGPLASPYGYHFIYVRARTPERIPPLQEVATQVAYDMQTARKLQARELKLQDLVDSYVVETTP